MWGSHDMHCRLGVAHDCSVCGCCSRRAAVLCSLGKPCGCGFPLAAAVTVAVATAVITTAACVASMCPGAGKSTLMDILAGRKSVGELKGLVLVNKQRQHKETFRKRTAYVPQVRAEEWGLLGFRE